ncbi:MAG TPA: hypothetical protein VFT30_08480 [Nitrospira sp.]|nr:hypothetical protein [Nitrospira sp.]
MREYDPEVEEVDLEDVNLYEGKPDFEASPAKQADQLGNQDELEQGEALGDDLAPAQTKPVDRDVAEEQEDPDA